MLDGTYQMLQNKMTMIGLGVSPKTQLLLLRNDSRWPSLGDVGEYELTVQLHYDRTSTEIVLLVKGTDSWGSVKDQLRSQRPDLSDKGRLQIVHNGSGSSEPNDNHSLFVSYAGSVFRAGRANTVNVVCGIQEMEAAAFEDVPVIVDNGDDSEKDYPLDFETELCVFAKHLSTEIESLSGPSKRNFWITWDEPTVKKHVHNFLISDKRHLNDFRALTDEQIDQLAGYLARASGHAISSSHITRALTAMSPTASSNSALPVEADFDAWNLTLSDFVDRLTLLYHTEIVKPPRPWDVATMTMLIKRSMYAYFNATNGYEIPEEFGALTDQQIARLSADLTSTSGHVVSSSLIRRAISALRYQACDISTEAVKRLKSKPAEDENREAAEGVSIQLAQMPQVQTSVASSDPAQYYAQLAQTPEARTQLAARRTSVDPDLRVPTADLEADKARKIVCFRDFFKAAEQLVEETETLKVCCFCGQGVGPEQMAHARNDFDAQIQTNEEALMACRVLYRSKPCYRWQAGACKFGDECRFKHETSDAKHRPSDAQKAANATNAADDETVSSRMSRRGSDFLKLAAVVKKTMEKKRVCGFCNQSAGPAIVAHIDAEVQKTELSLTHLANEPRDTNVTECAQNAKAAAEAEAKVQVEEMDHAGVIKLVKDAIALVVAQLVKGKLGSRYEKDKNAYIKFCSLVSKMLRAKFTDDDRRLQREISLVMCIANLHPGDRIRRVEQVLHHFIGQEWITILELIARLSQQDMHKMVLIISQFLLELTQKHWRGWTIALIFSTLRRTILNIWTVWVKQQQHGF